MRSKCRQWLLLTCMCVHEILQAYIEQYELLSKVTEQHLYSCLTFTVVAVTAKMETLSVNVSGTCMERQQKVMKVLLPQGSRKVSPQVKMLQLLKKLVCVACKGYGLLTSVTVKVEFSATCQVRQGSFQCMEHINILFHCHEDGLSRRMVHMKPDLHLEHER